MAAEGSVRLPADGTGKRLRALVKTVSGDEVYMEVLALADEDGTLISVDNPLHIINMSHMHAIPAGLMPATVFSINKFGHNPSVAATLETIWGGSGLYPYMDAADQLQVLSDDDEDGGGGATGALTIELFGLDANYNPVSETITLDGTTPKTTTKSYLRIFRAIIRTAGSTGWNIGTITIRDQDTSTTRALIEPFFNQTLMATWTVPAGYSAYITSWYLGTVSNKNTELTLFIRPFGEVFQAKRHIHIIQSTYNRKLDYPEPATEKSEIEIRGMASGGGGDVSVGFSAWYAEN